MHSMMVYNDSFGQMRPVTASHSQFNTEATVNRAFVDPTCREQPAVGIVGKSDLPSIPSKVAITIFRTELQSDVENENKLRIIQLWN